VTRTHAIAPDQAGKPYQSWDHQHPPALTIEPDDTVVAQTLDTSGGYYGPGSTTQDARTKPPFAGHPLTGPIAIAGAWPGDLLEVEIVDVAAGSWGYTSEIPKRGLLPEDFPDFHLVIWDLTDGKTARAPFGARVPMRPFCGILGLAPAERGPLSTTPPRRTGGNLDLKQLVAGTTLLLPIEVPGALFSVGDAHAAQGDGEVCTTAIETPATATLRFHLRQGAATAEPQARISRLESPFTESRWHVTMSSDPDLGVASKNAIRYLIEWLVREYALDPRDAYVLCSVAAELRISQLVNRSVTVSALFPTAVFGNAR
jgi:acetamidase/formamidase